MSLNPWILYQTSIQVLHTYPSCSIDYNDLQFVYGHLFKLKENIATDYTLQLQVYNKQIKGVMKSTSVF